MAVIMWNESRLLPKPFLSCRKKKVGKKKGSGSLFVRLADKIQNDLGVVCMKESFRRTYAGYWQRRAGAWSWEGVTEDGRRIGSIWSVSELLKSPKLGFVESVNWHTELEIGPDA